MFEFDPDPAAEFESVVECARRLRMIFQAAKLESFVETTGGEGLHVCVPVEPDLGWHEAKTFTQRLARELVRAWPKQHVATQSKAQRKGQDMHRLLTQRSRCELYCTLFLQARTNAPIAAPLEWDELNAQLRPDQYNILGIEQRLAGLRQDPFAGMVRVRQRLRPGT